MANTVPPLLQDILPGAIVSSTGISIPFAALNSIANAAAVGLGNSVSGIECAFSLVDSIQRGIAACTGLVSSDSTVAQRIVDADTIRKDYTFRFNLAYNTNNLNVETP